jgi:hypothetical protein
MFDLTTIMKAIEMVGPVTDAGRRIYEGFHAALSGASQAELRDRYAAAREQSDRLHAQVQRDLNP